MFGIMRKLRISPAVSEKKTRRSSRCTGRLNQDRVFSELRAFHRLELETVFMPFLAAVAVGEAPRQARGKTLSLHAAPTALDSAEPILFH